MEFPESIERTDYILSRWLQLYNKINDFLEAYKTIDKTIYGKKDIATVKKIITPLDIAKLTQIYNNITKDYYAYGYEYSYFTFVNPDTFVYNIHKHNIEPTAETFELGTNVKDESLDVLQRLLQHGFNINRSYTWEQRIKQSNNYSNLAGWNKAKLIEILAESELFQEEIVEVVKTIEYVSEGAYEDYLEAKEKLLLKNAGTNEDSEGAEDNESAEDNSTPEITVENLVRYDHRYPNLEKMGTDLNQEDEIWYLVRDPENLLEIEFHPIKDRVTRSPLKNLLLDKCSRFVLEQLYYLIKNPQLNFQKVCEVPYMDKYTLRRVILNRTPITLPKEQLWSLTKTDLCEILDRYLSLQQIQERIPEASQELILQPFGKTYFKYLKSSAPYEAERTKRLGQEELSNYYQRYLQQCSDPHRSLEELIYDALELGLSNQIFRGMTRDQICEIISRYIQSVQYQI